MILNFNAFIPLVRTTPLFHSYWLLLTVGGQRLHSIYQAGQTMKSRIIGELGCKNRPDIWRSIQIVLRFKKWFGAFGCRGCSKRCNCRPLLYPFYLKTRPSIPLRSSNNYHHLCQKFPWMGMFLDVVIQAQNNPLAQVLPLQDQWISHITLKCFQNTLVIHS